MFDGVRSQRSCRSQATAVLPQHPADATRPDGRESSPHRGDDADAGSGKSVLVTQFIAKGLRGGEPAIVAIFEEGPEGYSARAAGLDMDLDAPRRRGRLEILYLRPLDLSVDETMREIVEGDGLLRGRPLPPPDDRDERGPRRLVRGQESHARMAGEAGFDVHLTKPVDLARIEGFLQTLLGPKAPSE